MESVKTCTKCDAVLTRYPSGGWYCKPCHKITQDRWRAQNKETIRTAGRTYNYKLSTVQYTKMLIRQENRCALCRVEFTESIVPYVDHNHSCCPAQKTCGKCIRGLLCRDCNSFLGRIKDSAVYCTTVIRYLKRYARRFHNVKQT